MALTSSKCLVIYLFVLALWCIGVLGSEEDLPQPRAAPRVSRPRVSRPRVLSYCGVQGQNRSCLPGWCCSRLGFCATTIKYCGVGCQTAFSDSCQVYFGPPGPRTDKIPRPKVDNNIPYGVNIKTCKAKGVVALTFDDGPLLNSTEKLLDLLDKHSVRATFFVAGNNNYKGHIDDNSTGYPAMLRRMYSAGHQIASHTWSHPDLNTLTTDKIREEMMYNEMALRNIFGWFPSYMRAPFLRCSRNCMLVMREWGYHVIHANLNTKDWALNNMSQLGKATAIVSEGLSADSGSNSYIIGAHDTLRGITCELAKSTINMAKERGYKLVTVGECLGDPEENWYRVADDGETTSGESPGGDSAKGASGEIAHLAYPLAING